MIVWIFPPTLVGRLEGLQSRQDSQNPKISGSASTKFGDIFIPRMDFDAPHPCCHQNKGKLRFFFPESKPWPNLNLGMTHQVISPITFYKGSLAIPKKMVTKQQERKNYLLFADFNLQSKQQIKWCAFACRFYANWKWAINENLPQLRRVWNKKMLNQTTEFAFPSFSLLKGFSSFLGIGY